VGDSSGRGLSLSQSWANVAQRAQGAKTRFFFGMLDILAKMSLEAFKMISGFETIKKTYKGVFEL
jgi:hypothetical protein